jgi:hypothetical protein
VATTNTTDDCRKNEHFDPQSMYEPGEMPHRSGSVAVFRDMATPDRGLGFPGRQKPRTLVVEVFPLLTLNEPS